MKKLKVYGFGCKCEGTEPDCSGFMSLGIMGNGIDEPVSDRPVMLFFNKEKAEGEAAKMAPFAGNVKVISGLLILNKHDSGNDNE